MVASVGALSSAGQASSYYEADDYYAEGGLAPSEWFGAGAGELRLTGEVDRATFKELLEGQVDERQLGTVRDGKFEHRPGWDVTLSAPKSVSIMAQVAGDRRLINAHTKAVRAALRHIETQLGATRIRQEGDVRRLAADKLVVASFQHGTSRAQDPQLHTHNVILNMCKDEGGTWRSLEPRAIYQMQKQIGAIYRQELAHVVVNLGYRVEIGKDSTFEIAGVPGETLKAFSSRSAAIEAALEVRGQDRGTASAAEKQVAALNTREAKADVDQRQLAAEWRQVADANGFTEGERRALIEKAVDQAASTDLAECSRRAATALTRAIASLEERQSVFSEASLREEAGRLAMGRANYETIGREVGKSVERGDLQPRTFIDRRGAEFKGYASRANVQIEQRMLHRELVGRGAVAPIASVLQAHQAVAQIGRNWNDEQRSATVDILSSRNRFTGLQGYAGTAKTSTVLAAVAAEAKSRDVDVRALAPTAAAALVLGEALNARADTVARHLLVDERIGRGPSLWIVDEASLLSARDTEKLFRLAEERGARVLLVGDEKQLGSVEAGAAFSQLQSHGMRTAKLTTILRQTDEHAKAAVAAALVGDAKRALSAIESGRGGIVEHSECNDRFKAIASRYAELTQAERKKTLVIEPSRAGRDILTAEIRNSLIAKGELGPKPLQASALVPKNLTRENAKDAGSYAAGDTILFRKDYRAKGVARSDALSVISSNAAKGSVALKHPDGRTIDWRPRQWGAASAQAFEDKPLELRQGDKLLFTRNDKAAGRINGQTGEVLAVDPAKHSIQLRTATGTETLDLDQARDRHLRHAYVDTAFAAQGRTADRVLIHAESRATNLIDQPSFYVAVSRAKMEATVFTDCRKKLSSAIRERAGHTQTALTAGLPHRSGSKGAGL
jgi:conjugative relaxase-like TrwC/TraI family protein